MWRTLRICAPEKAGNGYSMPNIQIATMPSEIDRCFPVMRQLRPMLIAGEFVGRIQTQQAEGYQLAFLEVENAIVALAGFRVQTLLWSGKTLYVDDLVTDEGERSKGYGESMLVWLIALAKEAGCTTFMLDSGTHRHEAHAFYFRHGLRISDFHFKLPL
jgi:GNAT superfamily N-acetyltransferase